MLLFEDLEPRLEAQLAERHPDAPDEWLIRAVHWDLEAAAHKKRGAINHAVVGTEGTTRGALRFGDGVVTQRSGGPEPRHSFMKFATGLGPILKPRGLA